MKNTELFRSSSLLHFPPIIALVRGAWVRVSGKIVRVDVALVELGGDGGRPDIQQRKILRVI